MNRTPHAMARKPQWIAGTIGFVLAWLVSLAVVAFTSAESSPAEAMGRAFGAALLPAIVMMLVLRHSPLWFRGTWLGLFLLFALGINAAVVLLQDRMRKERALTDEVRVLLAESTQRMSEIRPDSPPVPPVPKPAEDDPFAMASYLLRSVLQQRLESQRLYLADLDAIGMEQALAPQALKRQGGQARAQNALDTARKAVRDWLARERRTNREFLSQLRSADLPEGFRRGALDRAAKEDIDRHIKAASQSELAIIEAMETQHRVLLAHRWVYQDEMVLFMSDAGLSAYQEATDNLQRRLDEGERLRMGRQAELRAMADELR